MNYTIKKIKNKRNILFRNIESAFINSEKMVLPDFLIIGAQKGGTTWLYEALRQIDEIYFPYLDGKHDPTEVRYFDESLHHPIKWYSDLYKDHQNKVKGDKTPKYYLLSPKKIKFIKKLMPQVKLIFILRNPIERAWSQAVMNLTKFDKINLNGNKEAYVDFLKKNLNKGFYSQFIENWQMIFPVGQMKILLYDHLKNDPLGFLAEVTKFLEIDLKHPPAINLKKKVNSNPKIEIPEDICSMLREAYRDEINLLQSKYNLDVGHWNEV